MMLVQQKPVGNRGKTSGFRVIKSYEPHFKPQADACFITSVHFAGPDREPSLLVHGLNMAISWAVDVYLSHPLPEYYLLQR